MFGLEINGTVVVEQREILEKALSTDDDTRKALTKLISQVIQEARSQAVRSISFAGGDPHQSRQAVRSAVYRKLLGGNINIYQSRRAHGRQGYAQRRTLQPHQRGGNRITPSQRTIDIQTYSPQDRGFILRFNNSGTGIRQSRYGNRGAITSNGFFGAIGGRVMSQAADRLSALIDEQLNVIMNSK